VCGASFLVTVHGEVKPSKNRLRVTDAGADDGSTTASFSPPSRRKFQDAFAPGAMFTPVPEGGHQLVGTMMVAVDTGGGLEKASVTVFK
jgi:hypothetical protein